MIRFKSTPPNTEDVSLLAIPVCEDRDIHEDPAVASLIGQATAREEFKGRKGDELVFFGLPEIRAHRVAFLGLGKGETINAESLRSFAGRAVKMGINRDLKTVLLVCPAAELAAIPEKHMLEALLEGAILGNHLFDAYKQEKKHLPLKSIFIGVPPATAKKYTALPGRVKTVCEGTIRAREWINIPSNDKRPEQWAKSVADVAATAGLGVTVLDEKALRRQKFGALLAVAAGSTSSPRMVVLSHAPEGAQKCVVLVGKGVTFDSGGINLKPTGSIETMKTDMSGAAAVAATMLAVASLKPRIKVIGVLPMVENMPSGSATRPGDIVTAYTGKTVEIGNTDAEGRLILIDAMAWAIKKYKPDTVIDLATLTGACVVALGEKIAGVFSSDDELAREIVASGEKTHERCWHMPLPEDYKELLKNDVADISNVSGGRWGGAITAAIFLKEFVGDTRWAHIDIAGPARAAKATDYCIPGGTGFGVRLLCDLLEKV